MSNFDIHLHIQQTYELIERLRRPDRTLPPDSEYMEEYLSQLIRSSMATPTATVAPVNGGMASATAPAATAPSATVPSAAPAQPPSLPAPLPYHSPVLPSHVPPPSTPRV
ncbi:hypothetical protein SISSUDRAFT_1068104 [Sistotremastrum suecicum HHB10207 ss-3]|uniref:Uncharacterized protein n=1 Tax=Sistotremastrum suecicum HHB10207 ss-3 TaxID=1314776 RepID=A0A165WFL9_9AGAM|nr:hypothetical protein SISSUDRAFT_1068104 [Sistotremastrum suecicum HHB10207 ss-3]